MSGLQMVAVVAMGSVVVLWALLVVVMRENARLRGENRTLHEKLCDRNFARIHDEIRTRIRGARPVVWGDRA